MKIQKLELYTTRLKVSTKFYSEILELDVITKTNNSISLQIGESTLKLVQREKFTPYHYAINIPANQEIDGFEWLKERVQILKHEKLATPLELEKQLRYPSSKISLVKSCG